MVFKNQNLNDYDLINFSKNFGELDPPGPNPYGITFLPEFPEINVISNVKSNNGVPIGNLGDGEAVWHADMTYNELPPKAGILYALEVPEGQGNTHFANMSYAYETLPSTLKEIINDKILIHDSAHNSAGMLRKGYTESNDPSKTPGAKHPLVIKDPNTNKKLSSSTYCILKLVSETIELPGSFGNASNGHFNPIELNIKFRKSDIFP